MDTWFPTFRRLTSAPASSWFPTLRRFTNASPHERWTWWPWYTTASQRKALLRLIAVSIEENIPLVSLLTNWACDESGLQQRRLRRLVRLLQAGRALPDALEEVPGILREEELLAVRFDSQMGTRTATVRKLLTEPVDVAESANVRLRRAIGYFCTVVPISLLVIAFMQVKIMPVLEFLTIQHGVTPSPYAAGPAYLLTPFTAASGFGFVVIFVLLLVLFATRWGRAMRRAIAGRVLRSVQELLAADVLQKVSLALATGRPLASALSTLARYHFDPAMRQKLLFVRNEMEQGAEVWHSLVAVKMVTPPEANLLRTSESTANRCWILDQLIHAKRRRTTWRLERSTMFALPAVVLFLAMIVFVQSLSLFDPLVRLIDGLL